MVEGPRASLGVQRLVPVYLSSFILPIYSDLDKSFYVFFLPN